MTFPLSLDEVQRRRGAHETGARSSANSPTFQLRTKAIAATEHGLVVVDDARRADAAMISGWVTTRNRQLAAAGPRPDQLPAGFRAGATPSGVTREAGPDSRTYALTFGRLVAVVDEDPKDRVAPLDGRWCVILHWGSAA